MASREESSSLPPSPPPVPSGFFLFSPVVVPTLATSWSLSLSSRETFEEPRGAASSEGAAGATVAMTHARTHRSALPLSPLLRPAPRVLLKTTATHRRGRLRCDRARERKDLGSLSSVYTIKLPRNGIPRLNNNGRATLEKEGLWRNGSASDSSFHFVWKHPKVACSNHVRTQFRQVLPIWAIL